MKILITNHWLKKLGGSETFTYTLVKAAKEWGADVDLMTVFEGMVSDRVRKDLGVRTVYSPNYTYDMILANHHSTVEICHQKQLGPIIQTCHGIIPKLEQPSQFADAFVAISEEVERHIKSIYAYPVLSVIRNSIDTERFKDRTLLAPGIKSVLSLSHSEKLNAELKEIFNRKGIQFKALNKFKNPVWDVEKEIWQHDLVISLGRGAYEAFACGRPVLVLDHRPYQELLSDGMATPDNMYQLATCNFSGRYFRKTGNLQQLINRELELYNDDNQVYYRHWAVENLDYRKNFEKYLELWKKM
ncbi:MAG: glycosyltransferase [Prolixibacteraceae bacterium]